MDVILSLRKTKVWGGSACYQLNQATIYLLKIYEEFPDDFNMMFCYVYFHEILHLLLQKFKIKGCHNEQIIFELASRIETILKLELITEEDLQC